MAVVSTEQVGASGNASDLCLGGTRGVGRPAIRWLDSADGDLKTTGFRNWRRKSQDRDQWRAIVKEAKVHHGL
jgi:hypothetical protein